jgi:hypothetical protein
MDCLGTIANIASIIGGGVAAVAAVNYCARVYRRVVALEAALKKKTKPNDNTLTADECAAEIGATREQVIEAAGWSRNIKTSGGQLGNGYVLEYIGRR